MVPFLNYKKIYASFSGVLLAISIFSIAFFGFHYSIEFTGGSTMQYAFQKEVTRAQVETIAKSQNIPVIDIETKGKEVIIRSEPINEKQEGAFKKQLETSLVSKLTVLKSETVSASLSQDTVRKTAIAAGIAIIGILLYVAYAFRNFTFAMAAVVALFHDVIILIGSYSLLSHFIGAELDTLFVTAVLTTMSFSVHDTIVMFDQLRYYMKRRPNVNIEELANLSITETFVRSLNNSMTVVFMLLALVLLGGDTIRYFVMALLIGTLVGTYSSPFVAMNFVVWLLKRKKS